MSATNSYFYSAIVAIVAAHVVLIAFIFFALKDDSETQKRKLHWSSAVIHETFTRFGASVQIDDLDVAPKLGGHVNIFRTSRHMSCLTTICKLFVSFHFCESLLLQNILQC